MPGSDCSMSSRSHNNFAVYRHRVTVSSTTSFAPSRGLVNHPVSNAHTNKYHAIKHTGKYFVNRCCESATALPEGAVGYSVRSLIHKFENSRLSCCHASESYGLLSCKSAASLSSQSRHLHQKKRSLTRHPSTVTPPAHPKVLIDASCCQ